MGAVKDAGKSGDFSAILPWLMAVADPKEKWWRRLRRNPKRLGEVSQAAFLLKAGMMGFNMAVPWGDSERYDFVVWAEDAGGGRKQRSPARLKPAGEGARSTQARGTAMLRVQVKGTGRLYRRGYEVQAVRSTRGQGKKRYTKKDIDVLAAHVQPLDVWYLLPIEAIGRTKSLRFYPDIKSRRPRWEKYREAWEVLEDRGNPYLGVKK
jgi:hypothetical protein